VQALDWYLEDSPLLGPLWAVAAGPLAGSAPMADFAVEVGAERPLGNLRDQRIAEKNERHWKSMQVSFDSGTIRAH
jgi:hypothetical protein